MKLESFKDKKETRRKMILISLGVITIIGVSLLLYKTFASFKREVTFPMMSGKVNYYGNADLIFVFYKEDQLLDEMPKKGNSEKLVFDHGTCDNGATIEWNENEWAPLVKGLNNTKTTCSLYFKEYEIPTLRLIATYDTNGMWKYKNNITKIVIETKKQAKTAGEGQKVYGPFNEGLQGNTITDAIQSYVVCEAEDTNCIGYLQGDGGIKLNTYGSNLFNNFSQVTEIEGIQNLDISSVKYMERMFAGMQSLTKLKFPETFDTSGVTNMSSMFDGMSNLQTLTFGDNFDTSSVTNMSSMFGGMSNLQTLDLSGFDTSLVTDMWSMFSGMGSLTSLTFGNNFDTSSVQNMSQMFRGMSNLQTLTFGDNFDTSKVTDMSGMFGGMSNLQTLNLSSFDTSNVKKISSMFAAMSSIQELDLSSFNTSNVDDMSGLFGGCTSLTKINYGTNFIHKTDADVTSMFGGRYAQSYLSSCPANRPDATVHSSWEGVSFD